MNKLLHLDHGLVRVGREIGLGRKGGMYPIPPNRKDGVGKSAPSQMGVCHFCGR